MNPELTQLKELLARHDWYYDYSDDHSVWCRGRDHRQTIHAEEQRLARECLATQEEITALFEQYRPKNL
jgi:hypothetical protein